MNFEDELQSDIESGAMIPGKDAEAYRKIFAALKKAPISLLSDGFADEVIRRSEQRRTSTSYGAEILAWVTSVGLLLLGAAYVVNVTNINFSLGFLNGLKPYIGVFAFGLMGVIVFQYLDKRLLGKKIVQHR